MPKSPSKASYPRPTTLWNNRNLNTCAYCFLGLYLKMNKDPFTREAKLVGFVSIFICTSCFYN